MPSSRARTRRASARWLKCGGLAEVIDPPPLPHPVCRDPDDDEVLALAIAAKVDLIVSGDNDLLSLGNFEGVPIIAPAHAVRRIGAS